MSPTPLITGTIRSREFSKGRGGKTPRLIVIHTMETPESAGRAQQVATWFASSAPDSSVHYCVDNREVWACVSERDTAFGVGHFATNQRSISIELAGRARQTPAEWDDAYSVAELKRAARLVVAIANRWAIPLQKISPTDVAAGKAGICGHVDITKALHVAGGHTDPGPNFPWADFLQLIAAAKERSK